MTEDNGRTAAAPRIGEALEAFLTLNPEARLESKEAFSHILEPWSDDTIALHVDHKNAGLIKALNSVRLPPRFTALWHQGSNDLEFIFGPLPQSSALLERSFAFLFDGVEYHCEYAEASECLQIIAQTAEPAGPPSATDHRHLYTVRLFLRSPPHVYAERAYLLTSFWVRGFKGTMDELVSLAKHLNFYMRYFDRRTPRIEIHHEAPPELPTGSQRHLFGEFPASLLGRRLDPYLLDLWDSACGSDPTRSFLYSYQVLEYAAFYHVREATAQAIRRRIARPDVAAKSDAVARDLLDLLVDERQSEERKIQDVVQQLVEPRVVWDFIAPNFEFFCKECAFDGGFILQPLALSGWELQDFEASWIPKLPDSLRKLRNALVHAREQRQAFSIAPTRNNQLRLRFWSDLAEVVASQVMTCLSH